MSPSYPRTSRPRSLLLIAFIGALLGCGPRETPQAAVPRAPASWASQRAAAHQAASAIDPTIALVNVLAQSETGDLNQEHLSLVVKWEYRRPSGSTIRLRFHDTDPQLAIILERAATWTNEAAYNVDALASVQLSPADALKVAKQDPLVQNLLANTTNNVYLDMSLMMAPSFTVKERYGVAAIWSLMFRSSSSATPGTLYVDIDASTGAIVDTEVRQLEPAGPVKQ